MKVAIDLEMADRIKSRCERMLRRAEPDIPILEKQEKWEALGSVVKGACRNALQIAMIEMRCNNDIELSRKYFSKARTFSSSFKNIPEGVITASSFDIPIYCCLLSGDIDAAKQLADIIFSGKLKIVPGSHFDVHAQVLAAFILGDLDSFATGLSDFKKLEPNYWWEKQGIYFELYRSVISADEVTFNGLLHEAAELFKARGSDKEFGDQLGEYGGLEYNQFAIDFMSIGIAILAKAKGIKTSLDNDYFPAELVG